MTVSETLTRIQQSFKPSAAAGLNKIIQLHITGQDNGTYALKIADQQCELISGGVEKPDVTLTVSDQDWVALTTGQLDAMNAFLTGKIKVEGDRLLVMRIPSLFSMK
ncbi:MAG TPA: SCP2 sterol-binding domain-containing protein [Dictyobacter sp.]|jgi:putative sterol carrier protein|nr:SCP2 sterol-binding domain-containing protein [Dictyobacter sp.]